MPTNDPHPSKNQRREEARAKAAALRAQQERARKRNQIIGISVLVVAVIGLGVGIYAVVKNTGKATAAASAVASNVAYPEDSAAPAMSAVTMPKTADTSSGGIPVSNAGVGQKASSGVTVDLYFDFMCPYCGIFDRTNASDLAALAAEDGVTLVYHPLAIMDNSSLKTFYSTRAANAVGVVADQDPDHFPAFVTALYAKDTQPQEGTSGLTDAKIAEVAQSVGVASSVTDQFTSTVQFQGHTVRTFAPWAAAALAKTPTNPARDNEVTTPTVTIDGTRWDGDYSTAGNLKAAVEAAKGSGTSTN